MNIEKICNYADNMCKYYYGNKYEQLSNSRDIEEDFKEKIYK